jgi:hypothetical protein
METSHQIILATFVPTNLELGHNTCRLLAVDMNINCDERKTGFPLLLLKIKFKDYAMTFKDYNATFPGPIYGRKVN